MKKVPIGAKPRSTGTTLSPDDWVNDRPAGTVSTDEAQKMKRLTIDVSANLHRQIKTKCGLRGVNMADEIRSLLENNFGGPEA